MNRRNFILGLGTAATLSGAASVTGATIQNAVEPAANFQVVAQEDLNVERNDALTYSELKSDGNYSTFLQDDDSRSATDFDVTGADDNGGSFPNMTISNATDGDLEMALATQNENVSHNRNASTGDGGSDTYTYPSKTPYDDEVDGFGTSPLQIVNEGGSVDVSVEYEVGSAVGTSADERSLVARVFQFYIGGTQVSPDPTAVGSGGTQDAITSSNTATVSSGTTDVDFRLNYSDGLADELADLVSGGSVSFDSTNQNAVDLLELVRFGEDDA